jgi:hypothetical protein
VIHRNRSQRKNEGIPHTRSEVRGQRPLARPHIPWRPLRNVLELESTRALAAAVPAGACHMACGLQTTGTGNRNKLQAPAPGSVYLYRTRARPNWQGIATSRKCVSSSPGPRAAPPTSRNALPAMRDPAKVIASPGGPAPARLVPFPFLYIPQLQTLELPAIYTSVQSSLAFHTRSVLLFGCCWSLGADPAALGPQPQRPARLSEAATSCITPTAVGPSVPSILPSRRALPAISYVLV